MDKAILGKLHAPRRRTGCLECRKRHVRCDEVQPICGNCSRSRVRRVCNYTLTIPLRDRRAVDKARRPWEQLVFMTTTHAAKHSEEAFIQGAMGVIMHGVPDPFHCLSIEMPLQSKELFHYFCHIDHSMNAISQDAKTCSFKSMMNDPHALRLTLMIAALHFEWTTGSMQSFESTFLFHKVELIHMVNKWITKRQPELMTCIISQIASLCFIELCLGHVFSAKAHLGGMLNLLKERKRHWQLLSKQDDLLYENSEEEELNDRYYLLLHSLFTRNMSRLNNGMCYGEFSQTYRDIHFEKLLASSSRLDRVEKNCDLSLKLDVLCLMPFLSRSLQTGTMSHWIDGADTIRDLRDLTSSLDMIRSKRSFSDSENVFAAACANGVASKLHVQYIASHIASISPCDNTPKIRRQMTTEAVKVLKSTWCGLYSATSLYLHYVLGLRSCSEKSLDDYIFHILRDALMRHSIRAKDCMSADRCLLFWQIFLGAISVEIRFRRSAFMRSESHTLDSSMSDFFDKGIRQWSQACQIRQWADARVALQKIAWPITHADEHIAKAVWERAHLS
ncbi:hypothetical protein GGI35DRAFT_464027 [Trichoderma velutinum]